MSGLRQPVAVSGITYPAGYTGAIPGYGTYPYGGLLPVYGTDFYSVGGYGSSVLGPSLYGAPVHGSAYGTAYLPATYGSFAGTAYPTGGAYPTGAYPTGSAYSTGLLSRSLTSSPTVTTASGGNRS